jgi:hypothetical protein
MKTSLDDLFPIVEQMCRTHLQPSLAIGHIKAALAASEAARERAEQSLKACRKALTRCIYLDDESEDAPADGTIEFLSRDPGLSCTGGMEWRRWAAAVRKAFPTADEAATLDAPATGEVG